MYFLCTAQNRVRCVKMTCCVKAKKEKETIARFKLRNSQEKKAEAKQHIFHAGTNNDGKPKLSCYWYFCGKEKRLIAGMSTSSLVELTVSDIIPIDVVFCLSDQLSLYWASSAPRLGTSLAGP